jgi:predicted RNA binding protein YcfA (HicA-like mRNA interferase family)
MPLKAKEIIRLVEQDGWFHVFTRKSHRHFKHPGKPGRVTIAGKLSDELSPAMENSVLIQAGLKKEH